MGVRPDVEVLGNPREEQVPHAASYQVALVTGARESVEDLQGVRIDPGTRDRVLAARPDAGGWLGARSGGGCVGRMEAGIANEVAPLSGGDSSLRILA